LEARLGPEQLHVRREALRSGRVLSTALPYADVRDPILRSWRRCVSADIPSGELRTRRVHRADSSNLLARAASPVLDRLARRVPRMLMDGVSEPDSDGGDVDGSAEDEFTFVVAGTHGTDLAQLVDGSFHGVALLVDAGVERRWPSAVYALGLAGLDLA
jgi:hypothetical protein